MMMVVIKEWWYRWWWLRNRNDDGGFNEHEDCNGDDGGRGNEYDNSGVWIAHCHKKH